MSITLFELVGQDPNKNFSPHVWKTKLALAHKLLESNSVPITFTQKHKIAFSGQSFVPVLKDKETVITDSWDIACYLEEHYPASPSLFSNESGKALAESTNQWCDTRLAKHIRPLVLMSIYNLLSEEDRVYFRESREQKLGMTLETFSATADQSLMQFRDELSCVRELLSMQNYLAGNQPGYADICLLSMCLWIACVSELQFLEKGDVVSIWYFRMLDDYPLAKKTVMSL